MHVGLNDVCSTGFYVQYVRKHAYLLWCKIAVFDVIGYKVELWFVWMDELTSTWTIATYHEAWFITCPYKTFTVLHHLQTILIIDNQVSLVCFCLTQRPRFFMFCCFCCRRGKQTMGNELFRHRHLPELARDYNQFKEWLNIHWLRHVYVLEFLSSVTAVIFYLT